MYLKLKTKLAVCEDTACKCIIRSQKTLYDRLPKLAKALKSGEETAINIRHQLTVCLLGIIEDCCRKKDPVDKTFLVALSEMLPLVCRNCIKPYTEFLFSYFELILTEPTAMDLSTEQSKILPIIIRVIGDLFFTLKSNVFPYLKSTMKLLFDFEEMSLEFRTECVAALGKIAAAVGGERFYSFMPSVMQLLQDSFNLATAPSAIARNNYFSYSKITILLDLIAGQERRAL